MKSKAKVAQRPKTLIKKNKLDSKNLVVAALLMVPHITDDQVAVAAGCLCEDVALIRRMMREELNVALKARYRVALLERIPDDVKADALAGIIKNYKGKPISALHAIQYVDKVVGVQPVESQHKESPGVVSMFELPAGTQVNVAMTSPPRCKPETPRTSRNEEKEKPGTPVESRVYSDTRLLPAPLQVIDNKGHTSGLEDT